MSDVLIEDEQIRVLAEAAGKEAVEPILDAFWQSNDELSEKLESALDAQDATTVAATAHALKGSSSNLGAVRMAATAKDVEAAAKAGDLETAREVFTGLLGQITATKSAFEEIMASV